MSKLSRKIQFSDTKPLTKSDLDTELNNIIAGVDDINELNFFDGADILGSKQENAACHFTKVNIQMQMTVLSANQTITTTATNYGGSLTLTLPVKTICLFMAIFDAEVNNGNFYGGIYDSTNARLVGTQELGYDNLHYDFAATLRVTMLWPIIQPVDAGQTTFILRCLRDSASTVTLYGTNTRLAIVPLFASGF